MDYEKKYKEALERAKNLIALYPQDAPGYREVFPELAESEEQKYVRTLKSLVSDFVRDKQPEDVAYYQKIYDWLDGISSEHKPVPISYGHENGSPKEVCYGPKGDPDPAGVWKPSEEQMSALLAVFNDPNNIWSEYCQLALSGLYEQLKKLM